MNDTARHGAVPRFEARDQGDERHGIQFDNIRRRAARMSGSVNNLNRPERGDPNLDRFTWCTSRQLLQDPPHRERHDGTIRLTLGNRTHGCATVGVGDSG